MLLLVLTVFIVFVLLVLNELWWRRRTAHGELSRKFIHITVGSFVAFWPFFLSWTDIRLLSVAFLIVVALSKYLHIFQAIHSVQRPTWGELFFAVGVGATTFVTHDKGVYAAALLQMSLADGLAAIVGTQYGRKQRYSVFGHAKSVVGTATFMVVSAAILLAYNHVAHHQHSHLLLIAVAPLAAIIENFGVRGLDNVLIPVAIAWMLTHSL